jgi:hypothetical protein
MGTKEGFQLLADAASVVQLRRSTKSSCVWFFALAALAVLLALFRSGFPQALWLVCAALCVVVGLLSLLATNTVSVLLSQIAGAVIIAGYSAYTVK